MPNVAEVVPNDDKPRLVQLLRSASAFMTTAERFGDGEGAAEPAIEPGMAGRTAFTLRVQTGCAEPCSYCIIPSTRGRPRSVPVEEVCREVRRVAAAGFREIVLTGVHLGSYGRDLTPASSLHGLLRALAAFSSAHDRARGCSSGSARWSRWIVRARSWRSSPGTRVLRLTFTCHCSMRATVCSTRCGGRIRSHSTPRSWTASEHAFRTRRSGQTSSSDFRVRPTKTSSSSRAIWRVRR